MDAMLSGKLLVAMPGIGDPRFEKSVIMMCAHTAEHAMGLVINKPKEELTLGDVLDHLGISAAAEVAPRSVLDGGPVRPDRGFVLHSEDFDAGEGTQSVAPGIRLTATRDVLEAVAGDEAPARFILALGCSGWGAGQLENELKQNAWLVVDASDAIVFGVPNEDKWSAAIRTLGFDPSQLSGDMGRA
ncbi:MAG TPA: YqgE/AlgH family protein [Caulobacterales bacterium]|nr:YqgE/AlgH family protein [Caulobacterales bacterium]